MSERPVPRVEKPHFVREKVPMAFMSSWQVGGPAEFLCEPDSVESVCEVLAWWHKEHNRIRLPLTVLGGGTNVLISDSGVRGLVVRLNRLKGVEEEKTPDRLVLRALSGTSKSEILRRFLAHSLSPAMFLAGLPGEVGGGVVMNAGVSEAWNPREFESIIDWIEVARPSGTVDRLSREKLSFTYRHCQGWQPGIITRVQLSWPYLPVEGLREQVRIANQQRLAKQPLDLPSCGSVFKNPPGEKAGRLIEECGLKGFTIGGAQVSTKHANFIVNIGKATALDLHQVIHKVQSTVLERKNISLKTEVVYLGDWDLV